MPFSIHETESIQIDTDVANTVTRCLTLSYCLLVYIHVYNELKTEDVPIVTFH